MKKKATLSLILIFTLLLSSVVPVFGIDKNSCLPIYSTNIEPRWQSVVLFTLTINVTESPISVGFMLDGQSGTTYSDGTLVLEKISGSHTGVIKTWTGLSSSSSTYMFSDNVQTYLTAGQYILTLTITATNNGVSEIIEDSRIATR